MAQRFVLARLMVANATLLSAVYLGIGLSVELLRRASGARWAERLSFALDALPARALELGHVMPWLVLWYQQGLVNEVGLRLIFGLTAVSIIFVLAVVVGVAMGLARAVLLRVRRA